MKISSKNQLQNLPKILEIHQDTNLEISLKNQNLDYELEINIYFGTLKLEEKYQNNLGQLSLKINLIGDKTGIIQNTKIAQIKDKFVWKSEIIVQGLDCFVSQYNQSLILSNLAIITIIPILKIQTPIIQFAKHGSNSVFLDPEQEFYLQSRGVKECTNLLILDFFKKKITH
jgi:hypothetical protein